MTHWEKNPTKTALSLCSCSGTILPSGPPICRLPTPLHLSFYSYFQKSFKAVFFFNHKIEPCLLDISVIRCITIYTSNYVEKLCAESLILFCSGADGRGLRIFDGKRERELCCHVSATRFRSKNPRNIGLKNIIFNCLWWVMCTAWWFVYSYHKSLKLCSLKLETNWCSFTSVLQSSVKWNWNSVPQGFGLWVSDRIKLQLNDYNSKEKCGFHIGASSILRFYSSVIICYCDLLQL